MKRWRNFTVALLALASDGCGFEPLGAEGWAAPPAYRVWWERTEACSGLRGAFEQMEWFVVPGDRFACPSGTCAGRWEPGRIFLASAWAHDEMVVRHEILHALIGRGGHPNPPFGAGCPLTRESWPGSYGAAAID
ncbi:MAG: hypothetical protein ACRENB_03335 [Gemmatimonadales bacterium]